MKKIIIFFAAILLGACMLHAQDDEMKELFENGEFFYYENEYTEALPYYLQLYKKAPENANFSYLVGVCYLNSNNEKDKAIDYLIEASLHVSETYNEGSVDEKNAPVEAYVYLGDAYFVANNIKKASEYYEKFKYSLKSSHDNYQEYVLVAERKIETCTDALNLQSIVVKHKAIHLDNTINSPLAEYNPVLTGDGQTLYYTSKQKFYDGVFYSKMQNGKWQNPGNFNIENLISGSLTLSSVSADGKTLFFYKDDQGIENIYSSKNENGVWSDIKKVDISSRSDETHACLASDGKTLYFTTNRNGGKGGLDIFKTVLGDNGKWGSPVNLGDNINTKYDETTPYVTNSGKTLYFSSQGHYNMGGYDIFRSDLQPNGEWSKPVNLGYPINTTDDNIAFFPRDNGKEGYISIVSSESNGETDIFKYELSLPEGPSLTDIKGKLLPKDTEMIWKDDIAAEVFEAETGKSVAKIDIDASDGTYNTSLSSGNYKLSFMADNQKKVTIELFIPPILYNSEMKLETEILSESGLMKKKEENVAVTTNTSETAENTTGNNTESTTSEISTNTGSTSSGGEIRISNILFGFNQHTTDQALNNLNKLAKYMTDNKSAKIEVAGYADLQGDEEYNIYLTKKRANFVMDYLVKKGVSASNITTIGKGEEKQIAIDNSPNTRKYNRRVEFKILKQGGQKLIIDPIDVPKQFRL